LSVTGTGASDCHVRIDCSRLCIATGIVVFLISIGPVGIAELIVSLLQIGSGITLGSGSVGLLDERAGPRHFFGWLRPLGGATARQTAPEYGRRDESYESS
jgi:hypothetical protein